MMVSRMALLLHVGSRPTNNAPCQVKNSKQQAGDQRRSKHVEHLDNLTRVQRRIKFIYRHGQNDEHNAWRNDLTQATGGDDQT